MLKNEAFDKSNNNNNDNNYNANHVVLNTVGTNFDSSEDSTIMSTDSKQSNSELTTSEKLQNKLMRNGYLILILSIIIGIYYFYMFVSYINH